MNGKGMQTMRTSEEMFRLILDVAREDDRIRAVVLSGSRADPEVPRDRYQDYDILFLVREVAPFYNNTAWIETTFGRPAVMQMPEVMTHPLLPPDGDGHFTYLMLFEDGNRIDLSIDNRPYIDDGEPAVVLLDKDGLLPKLRPRKEYWHIQPPDRSVYRDCCNEFWWCLNNVAKGIAGMNCPMRWKCSRNTSGTCSMRWCGGRLVCARDLRFPRGNAANISSAICRRANTAYMRRLMQAAITPACGRRCSPPASCSG